MDEVKTAKEKNNERSKRWRAANKERSAAIKRKWREANPDYSKKWYVDNKEKVLEQCKVWREKNKERCKENAAMWSSNNREKEAELSRLWYARNKNRESVKKKRNGYAKQSTIEIRDNYVRSALRLNTTNCPPELIEAKRAQIKIKRLLKESK